MDEKRLVDGATALAEKQSRVIKIEPAERPQNVRLRVAAYTRVMKQPTDFAHCRLFLRIWYPFSKILFLAILWGLPWFLLLQDVYKRQY